MSYTNLLRSFIFGSPSPEQRKRHQKPVNITADLKSVVVRHKKHNMLIKREADNNARVSDMFSRTSRPCPPFCIQPMHAADGVETIGELEILDYLAATTSNGDDESDVLLIDSRMQSWVDKGTIPCSINIPWTELSPSQGAKTKGIMAVLKHHFNAPLAKGYEDIDVEVVDAAIVKGDVAELFDYSNAKLLVLFCNGTWCGQTSESIKSLITFGYPAEKIKYFRNGMQGWVNLGLTTISKQDEASTECKIK